MRDPGHRHSESGRISYAWQMSWANPAASTTSSGSGPDPDSAARLPGSRTNPGTVARCVGAGPPGSSQIGAERLSRGVGEPIVQQRGTLPNDIAGLDGTGRHDRTASGR